jgi:excisionase family DNA binding protein
MDKLLTLEQVAELLQVPARTLYSWRYKGEGPQGLRVGRHIRYRAADLDRWVDEQLRAEERPTLSVVPQRRATR